MGSMDRLRNITFLGEVIKAKLTPKCSCTPFHLFFILLTHHHFLLFNFSSLLLLLLFHLFLILLILILILLSLCRHGKSLELSAQMMGLCSPLSKLHRPSPHKAFEVAAFIFFFATISFSSCSFFYFSSLLIFFLFSSFSSSSSLALCLFFFNSSIKPAFVRLSLVKTIGLRKTISSNRRGMSAEAGAVCGTTTLSILPSGSVRDVFSAASPA